MRKSLVIAVSLTFAIAASVLSQPGDLPSQKSGGPGKPLSPAEAQKLFKLPKGLRIELVACEPQIESPVAMAFAPDGKLWVVEMRDYPNGPAKGEKPAGRIRVLEDKDGDGFYETSTVWADNLLFANGLIHWNKGVIVTAAPHILYIEDDNGKAGKKTILYEGFAAENPQLRISNPILGLDGWIYCANGLRGGKVVNKTPGANGKPPGANADGSPIDLSGMDFRFNMITGQGEAISGLGQFGNTFDDWGNRFVCDNRHHLRHIVIENRYLKRNPNLAAPGVVEDISILEDGPLSSGGKIYPISKNWTTSSLHEGRFTAACGVFIYRGQLLGKPYSGAAFTCDPTGNLVHGEVMEQKGATFQSRPFEKGKEFLASPDDWFRPVFLTHGPDDAMYVVDMYRAVIEHPDFMPPELQKRPDLTLGKDKGRIWRIVPEKRRGEKCKIDTPNLDYLAGLLDSNINSWERQTIMRRLWEHHNKLKPDVLTKLLKTTKQPQAKILAAELLDRSEQLAGPELMRLLRDDHPRVRERALILAEKRVDKWEQATILAMRDDPDPRVRFQLALTLGENKEIDLICSLAPVAFTSTEDKWTRLAVASSISGTAGALLAGLIVSSEEIKTMTPGRLDLMRELGTLAAAEGATVKVLSHMQDWKAPPAWSIVVVNGLADGLARKGKIISAEIGSAVPPDVRATRRWFFEELLPLARRQALDVKRPVKDRLAGLQLFNQDKWSQSKRDLLALLNDDPQLEIRLAAVRTISSFPSEEAPKALMENWRSYGPAVRREVTEAMFRDPTRLIMLLDEIDAKRVKPGDLDALRTRQLVNHANKDIRARAEKLLKGNLPADRAKVLADYQPALTMKGDAQRGQEIFKKNCATCHRVNSIGTDVGPDIADTRTKTLSALLTDILNPNAAIDNNYVNYVVVTKAGRTVTGLLTNETSASITLKRAEGQTDIVLRADIDEIQSSGVSLMPEGLEKTITVAEMADLLSFLKNWRYLDGSVPTGK